MRLASLLVAAILVVACAPRSSEDLTQNRTPVFGGADDNTDGVVAVVIGPLDTPTGYCSGVAVSATIVVTAAHCVAGTSEVHVLVGARSRMPTQTVSVAAITPHPSYRGPGEDQRAGFDLAVLRTVMGLRVIPIALASEPDELSGGSSVDIVGFGRTARLDPASIGVRTRARVTVATMCDRLFAVGDETTGFCEGDSGGAVLSPTTGALVGVIGFGVRPSCAPPGWSTRVAPYAKWIASFIDGPGDSTCSTCPAPTVCAALRADGGVTADAAGTLGTSEAAQPEQGGCNLACRARGPSASLLVSAIAVWWKRRRAGARGGRSPERSIA